MFKANLLLLSFSVVSLNAYSLKNALIEKGVLTEVDSQALARDWNRVTSLVAKKAKVASVESKDLIVYGSQRARTLKDWLGKNVVVYSKTTTTSTAKEGMFSKKEVQNIKRVVRRAPRGAILAVAFSVVYSAKYALDTARICAKEKSKFRNVEPSPSL